MYKNYAKIRDSLGLSDAKVAEIAGVSRAIFTRWKKGETSPSNSTRFKICKVLGIEPTMFFSDQPEPTKRNISKPIDQDELLPPCDIVINVGGQKITIEQKDYAELKRGIDAYILAWVKNKKI